MSKCAHPTIVRCRGVVEEDVTYGPSPQGERDEVYPIEAGARGLGEILPLVDEQRRASHGGEARSIFGAVPRHHVDGSSACATGFG
jgi:hypothetical protein